MSSGHGRTVFACGADMKNRASFFRDGKFYFSSDTGDLSDENNFRQFADSVSMLKNEHNFQADIVAYDMHPAYFSSMLREIFPGAKMAPIQHHHAHVAGHMAHLPAARDLIGVSFDGTGYGLDGNLWGSELFMVTKSGFARRGHLSYMKMPGGDMAVKQPWRMAFSLLYGCLGEEALSKDLPFLKLKSRREYELLKEIIDRDINITLTSSCGRLFDAVSSLLGITHEISFEAEAAISLEKAATGVDDDKKYPFDIDLIGKEYTIGYRAFLDAIINDIEEGVPAGTIGRRFHNSVAGAIYDAVRLIGNETGLTDVVLSGGVFQNGLLHSLVAGLLEEDGFEVLRDDLVPLNDLGICVGQTYIALNSDLA